MTNNKKKNKNNNLRPIIRRQECQEAPAGREASLVLKVVVKLMLLLLLLLAFLLVSFPAACRPPSLVAAPAAGGPQESLLTRWALVVVGVPTPLSPPSTIVPSSPSRNSNITSITKTTTTISSTTTRPQKRRRTNSSAERMAAAVLLEMETNSTTTTNGNNTLLSSQDPRLGVETLYTSVTGIAIATTTSLISIIASFTIMLVIFRSSVGLGSVYHRILFGMSAADISQSLAMALTTLPMPKDMIYEQFDDLLVLGNNTTCNVQGFMYICGFLSGTMFTTILCYYYLCAIHFRMKDVTFRRYVEPASYFFNFSFTIILAALTWEYDLIHPTPLHPFCTTSAYPYWCRTSDKECMSFSIRRGGQLILWPLSTIFFGINALIIVVSLLIIVCSIYAGERKLRRYFKSENNNMSRDVKNAYWRDFTYTKSVVRQSLYYVSAFIAVYTFHFITSASDLGDDTLPPILASRWLQISYVTLRPSQGTFNLMIFLYHKIWSLRRNLPSLGFFEALKEVLSKGNSSDRSKSQDRIVSKIEIVMRDNALKNLQMAGAGGNAGGGDVGDSNNHHDEDNDEYYDDMEEESKYDSVDVIMDKKNDHDPYRTIVTLGRNKKIMGEKLARISSPEMTTPHNERAILDPDHGLSYDSESHSHYGAEKGSIFSGVSRDIFSILDSIQMLGSLPTAASHEQEQHDDCSSVQ
mmetsp:Transcript_8797/g.16602  ORF Transcript_8797/g.16602 Transcript_8797/m.16602 type:complete len:694 (+) Transcript_8797:336-2417(+)